MDDGSRTVNRAVINFLMTVYGESVSDVATILCAEAEGDTATLKKYLTTVRDFVSNLIEEI